MKIKSGKIVLLFVSTLVAIMVFATESDRIVRFIIPSMALSLLFLSIALHESDFGSTCGNYIISKRSYYKNRKKKTGAAVEASTGCFNTDAELSKLPAEYIVVCNYHKGGLKIDNVVIGPTGIYVIDSNNVSGSIDKVLSVLMLNDNLSMEGDIKSLKERLNVVAELFKSHGLMIKALKPVLCFTTARVNLMANENADGVLVVSLKNLLPNIVKAPVSLDIAELRNARELLMAGAEYAGCRNNSAAPG
jgi:Nuclease-related domain